MTASLVATKDARALDPWSCPPPLPHFDARKLVGSFETVAKAKAEHDLRLKHLRTAGSVEHRQLADKLESCAPKARCRSAACTICCRRLRMWFIAAVLEILGEIPDPILATLIPGDQAVPTADLREFSPKRFGGMLRQQLRRAGAGNRIIVGGIDGEYDESHRLWQPHFHLIAPAQLGPTLDVLRDRFYPRSDRVCRPVLTQTVNDPARQVSYCVKSFWPQKVRYLDAAGEKRQSPRRLDNASPRGLACLAGPVLLRRFPLPARGSPVWRRTPEIPGAQAHDRVSRQGRPFLWRRGDVATCPRQRTIGCDTSRRTRKPPGLQCSQSPLRSPAPMSPSKASTSPPANPTRVSR